MIIPLLIWLIAAAADAPASETAIDAFIAVLPPASSADSDAAADQPELDRLEKGNPGREAEVRTAFAPYRQCKREAGEKAVSDAVRSTARRLGDEQLARLASFYTGPDHALFGRLSGKQESDLSGEEKAELERIFAAYPLREFAESSRETEKQMWSEDGLLGALMKCEAALEAALLERGLTP